MSHDQRHTARALALATAIATVVCSCPTASAATSVAACKYAAAFSHVISDVQCLELQQIPFATTAAACSSACCNDVGSSGSPRCLTWVFSNSTAAGAGCWAGDAVCIGPVKPGSGWNGQSRVAVNPPAGVCNGTGPLQHPISDQGCSGLTGSSLGTAAACEAACCASATCNTWVFDPHAGMKGQHCWSGPQACQGPRQSGWNGGSKLKVNAPPMPVPPGPPPPLPSFASVDPRLTPRPSSVAGVPQPLLSLHGTWDFKPNLTATRWSPMLVPAEYTLQGFRVAAGNPVLYRRNFTLPAAAGLLGGGGGGGGGGGSSGAVGGEAAAYRVKLRADGCYSACNISVDGVHVGYHLGGFTPFELDVTTALQRTSQQHELLVELVGQSLADTMASGSKYATHDLGGITRKIYLMIVPELSIADLHYTVSSVSRDRLSASVGAVVTLANDGGTATAGSQVTLTLCKRGAPIPAHTRPLASASCNGLPAVASKTVQFGSLGAGELASKQLTFPLDKPMLWDPEHPNLYTLQADVDAKEQASIRLGVRELVLAGNQVLMNHRPIKTRGTTRHETHPFFGRSLQSVAPVGGQWERDIIAFRDLNVNWIRTSHYPPSEELMEAADELGMMVELEMPLCWDHSSNTPAGFDYTIQVHMEAVKFNRHHASVVAWSLANESPWGSTFTISKNSFLKRLDSTRPFMFDGGSGQTLVVEGGQLDIKTLHYVPSP
jgi:hypothetical protein